MGCPQESRHRGHPSLNDQVRGGPWTGSADHAHQNDGGRTQSGSGSFVHFLSSMALLPRLVGGGLAHLQEHG